MAPYVRPSTGTDATMGAPQINRQRPGAGGASTGGITDRLMKAKQQRPLQRYGGPIPQGGGGQRPIVGPTNPNTGQGGMGGGQGGQVGPGGQNPNAVDPARQQAHQAWLQSLQQQGLMNRNQYMQQNQGANQQDFRNYMQQSGGQTFGQYQRQPQTGGMQPGGFAGPGGQNPNAGPSMAYGMGGAGRGFAGPGGINPIYNQQPPINPYIQQNPYQRPQPGFTPSMAWGYQPY